MEMVKFEKISKGFYRFDATDNTYIVVQDEAGFAHRNWELWDTDEVGNQLSQITDQLGSRKEAVQIAFERDADAIRNRLISRQIAEENARHQAVIQQIMEGQGR